MSEPVTIGRATLYCGDCREILPTLRRPDAILGDPPYGQALKVNILEKGEGERLKAAKPGERIAVKRARNATYSGGSVTVWPPIRGDDKPFDPAHLLQAADKVLLWGAHKFGHLLPKGRTLVWDKVPTGKVRDQGDGETAWTNVDPDAPLRVYRLLWDGVCVGSQARHEIGAGVPRVHPTQKPEALMGWCLQFLKLRPESTVCDPYMGAGSTGIAALKCGHSFVGIELEPLYFETACRRIEDAQRQGDFFVGAAA